jgi:hypothetical protein
MICWLIGLRLGLVLLAHIGLIMPTLLRIQLDIHNEPDGSMDQIPVPEGEQQFDANNRHYSAVIDLWPEPCKLACRVFIWLLDAGIMMAGVA